MAGPAPTPISPLAPVQVPHLAPMDGVVFAAHAAGIRYKVRSDLMVAVMAPGTTVGGVLTRSLTASAPVESCRAHLKGGSGRVLVVNAGNANTFTGRRGVADVAATVNAASAVFGCKPDEVFVSSTGTIGVPLPVEKIVDALPTVKTKLSADSWMDAARAIMTTDTFPKVATRMAHIDGADVTITGFCKGSGMIAPDMATMLAYVFTDAVLAAPVVQALIAAGADKSFNCVTVDSDTSTSDTLLMFATGKAKHTAVTKADDPRLADFRAQLDALLIDLAQQVARDGEGASKFVEVRVTGADHNAAARRIALSIANSPLVKTAIAGEDANWGRIVAAVGKAGEKADRDKLAITIGGVAVTRDGEPVADYDETPVTGHMKGREIVIEVDVGIGTGAAIVWTCDLTHGYIDINGSYRT
ncbi:MAG: bifunctional glutamate N-acetyltransferase/amino-acid acetyltransferase ArgJ [Rhodospirillaceae bacterium]|nr:MAG: bifunctional glutamate N-acetyltransferase/amino-acid acetyltransferase ArgJ [Rhodospirillaceae bacterium]